ncbi:unnamed protein product [Closterium sp. NIES-65]|nr:unnamed protein product [Closterium sp. NIES-65]
MAEPRAVPFLMRLLVAWISFYYGIFMDAVAKGLVGLLESQAFDEENTSTATSHRSTRSAERARRGSLRRRRYGLLLEDLQGMGDGEFRDIYRINRAILAHVAEGMKHYMQPYVERYYITHEVANLVPIKYLASGLSYIDLSHLFGLSKTLCHELVDVWLMHFATVFKQQWVHFPTRDDLDEMAEEFRAVKGVPAVVGAIDGTHVHMKGMEGHRQDYWTRKSAYAVQLQVTCDARGIIWDFLIGYPGSAHDQRVFMDSLMEDWEQCFNYCQSATRMAVERCIGAFKGRWRLFAGRNDCTLWRVLAGASCCVVLHNMCETMGDVRRRNEGWANLPRNRDPWWTRGAAAEFKWEPAVPCNQANLRERRKRLGEALESSYLTRRRREPTLPQPRPG